MWKVDTVRGASGRAPPLVCQVPALRVSPLLQTCGCVASLSLGSVVEPPRRARLNRTQSFLTAPPHLTQGLSELEWGSQSEMTPVSQSAC